MASGVWSFSTSPKMTEASREERIEGLRGLVSLGRRMLSLKFNWPK